MSVVVETLLLVGFFVLVIAREMYRMSNDD